MGFFDRLFGGGNRDEQQPAQQGNAPQSNYGYGNRPNQGQGAGRSPQQMTDEQAVARYRYMLQTAPPETIEQAHAEAFSKLTPEQRQMVLQQLSATLPENERAANYGDDPQSLARMATRAEMRQPGTMERTFSNVAPAGGIGMGGLMAGSFISSFAGMFLGSMIAQQFFNNDSGYQDAGQGGDAGGNADAGSDTGGDESGTGDFAGNDMGGGYGDSGGDFGGGDFGGGDFGGDF